MDAQPQLKTGIAPGLSISGDLAAQEDVAIHGRFDGQVNVPDHHVFVSASASVKAKIIAHSITIEGTVDGTVVAAERVVVAATAHIRGHMVTPSLALADGAQFTGSVDPTRTEAAMQVAKYRQKHGPDAAAAG